MKTIITLCTTVLLTLAVTAQEYVRQPVGFLQDWIIQDMSREQITNNLPAAFHVTVDEPRKLVMEKDLEDDKDGVEEIQVEFGPDGNIEMIRFTNEPLAFTRIKSDIESEGYKLDETNKGQGYTEYEYLNASYPDIKVALINSEVDDMVVCHIIAVDEVQKN